MSPDDGLGRPKTPIEVTENKALLGRLQGSGVMVAFISDRERVERIIEELLPDAIAALGEVMKCAKALGVSMEDIFIGELPNGFVVEIPRIQRKIAVQGQIMAITTSTHGLSNYLDDKGEWRSILRQTVMCEMHEVQTGESFHSVVGESTVVGEKVDMNEYRDSPEHRQWYLARLSIRTEKEQKHDVAKWDQRAAQIIDGVRKTMTVRQLLTQERIVIEGCTLEEIGSMVGIRGFRDDRTGRIMLAAKIHGDGDPEVRRALQTLRLMA